MTVSGLGVVIALVLFLVSTSPSLLPRPWWAQAGFSGVIMVVGYLLGFSIDWVVRIIGDLIEWRVSYNRTLEAWLLAACYLAFAIAFVLALWRNYRHSCHTAALVGMRAPSRRSYLAALAGSFGVALVFVLIYAGIHALWRILMHLAVPTFPRSVAAVISWLLVALIVWVAFEWGIIKQGVRTMSRKSALRNRQLPDGVSAPHLPERSAGPASVITWDETSREGKRFLGGQAQAPHIAQVSGEPAREPVRVYASLGDNEDYASAVDKALEDLHRLGGLERPHLLVVVPTGSGWVDEWNVQAFEHLTGGNCATIAVQYSFLPSWITFLSKRSQASEGGRLIIDSVLAAIAQRDPKSRPKVYVTGESLGAYGAQAAFTSVANMLHRVDGALWIGTPGFTPLLLDIARQRHRGSPQIAPVIDNARHIRSATTPGDLTSDRYGRELGEWLYPRIVYVQHASDPVVWWHPSLWRTQPDWIREKAGSDVSDTLTWHPLVTFGQLLSDLPLAESAPSGHGHSYHSELLAAWRAILGISDGEIDEDGDARIAARIAAHLT